MSVATKVPCQSDVRADLLRLLRNPVRFLDSNRALDRETLIGLASVELGHVAQVADVAQLTLVRRVLEQVPPGQRPWVEPTLDWLQVIFDEIEEAHERELVSA